MKILLPIGGMMVGTALCCCGGDMSEIMEEMEAAQGGSAMSDDELDKALEAAMKEAEAEGEGSGTASVGGGDASGLCGRFKTDGMSVPSGLSVFSCTTMGTTESVVLRGSGAPKDSCTSLKSWATGAGWSVLYEAEVTGTTSITLKKDGNNLSLACMDVGGTNTVSVSISQGY